MPDFTDDELEAAREAEKAETAALQAELNAAKAAQAASANALTLVEAGFGHLSKVQRDAILAVHEGEVTSDSVLSTAQALGFTPAGEASAGPAIGAALGASSTSGAAAHQESPSFEMQIRSAKSQDDLLELLQANNYPVEWDGVVGTLERANATVPL